MQYLKSAITSPISFVSGGQFKSDQPWIHSERIIDTFEIIIGVEGEAYIQQDDTRYVVRPGSILLLLPEHTHKGYAYSNDDLSFYWFHFKLNDFTLMDEIAAESQITITTGNPDFSSSRFFLVPIFNDGKIDSRLDILFHQLLHIYNARYYTSMASDYTLTSILIELTHNFMSSYRLKYNDASKTRSFEKIIEWIRLNLNSEITSTKLSEMFHYNPDYFTRLFKSKTGMRMHEYINSLRISKAKVLIYQTNMSIKEIAYSVGFTDEKYFMKLFKKHEGISPSRYRNAFYTLHQNKS